MLNWTERGYKKQTFIKGELVFMPYQEKRGQKKN
jgi:hypothetical protein